MKVNFTDKINKKPKGIHKEELWAEDINEIKEAINQNDTDISGKVAKELGKGLSSHDLTTSLKKRILDSIIKSDIINDLISIAIDRPLSAYMGKVLNDRLTIAENKLVTIQNKIDVCCNKKFQASTYHYNDVQPILSQVITDSGFNGRLGVIPNSFKNWGNSSTGAINDSSQFGTWPLLIRLSDQYSDLPLNYNYNPAIAEHGFVHDGIVFFRNTKKDVISFGISDNPKTLPPVNLTYESFDLNIKGYDIAVTYERNSEYSYHVYKIAYVIGYKNSDLNISTGFDGSISTGISISHSTDPTLDATFGFVAFINNQTAGNNFSLSEIKGFMTNFLNKTM